MMQTFRFIILSLFAFFGAIYLLYVSYVYFNQGEMIFIANKLPKDYKFEFNQDFEELNIPSFDNKMLNGLFVIGVQAPSKTPSVPIFMAHRSCSSENCLNWNLDIKISDC